MAETYQLTWPEVEVVKLAIALAEKLVHVTDYGHIETKSFDLDTDKIGIKITIPPDPVRPPDIKPL